MLCNLNPWKDFCGLALLHLSGNHLSRDKQGHLDLRAAQGVAHPAHPHGGVCFLPCNMSSPAWSTPSSRYLQAELFPWLLASPALKLTACHWKVSPAPECPPVFRAGNTCRWLQGCKGNHYKLKENLNWKHCNILVSAQLKFSRLFSKTNFVLGATV